MKKIVILGANGYIGRNIAYILGLEPDQYRLALYGVEPESVDACAAYWQADMTDPEQVSKIDLDCDVIMMFVGRTGSANGFEQYNSFIDVNERTLLNLLTEYRRQNSMARIVFPSTRLVYHGVNGSLPENAKKEFKTVYAVNKFACEQYLAQFHRMYDVQYTIFRICVPYGTMIPGASSYGTAEFMLSKAQKGENISLYGDGTVRRTLTHMEDLCRTLIEGALSVQCANDVFNIGGEDYSLKEMAERIATRCGVGIDNVPWPETAWKIESGDTVFDSTKLDERISDMERHIEVKRFQKKAQMFLEQKETQ